MLYPSTVKLITALLNKGREMETNANHFCWLKTVLAGAYAEIYDLNVTDAVKELQGMEGWRDPEHATR